MKFYIVDCFAEEKYQGNELLVLKALQSVYNILTYGDGYFKPEEFKCKCGGRYCTGYCFRSFRQTFDVASTFLNEKRLTNVD